MNTEKINENGQNQKDPEYFKETSASERESHSQLMQECKRGEVLLGVDTIISRQFFTDQSTTQIRNSIKEEASLAKWIITGIYRLSHIIILSSTVLSFFVFGWWAPVAIAGLFVLWGISKSTAVIGYHPRGILLAHVAAIRHIQRISHGNGLFSRFLILAIGIATEVYLQRGWAFNLWVTLISSIPLVERLLYFFSTMYLEMMIMNNAIAWRLFNGKGAKAVPNPNRPSKH